MVQGAVSFVDRNGPAHGYAVLDRAHLTRMTFNDPSLEEEVLQLFERQAESADGAYPQKRADAAAELAASSAPTECDGAINRLAQAVDEARAEIAAMQRRG